MKDLIVNYSGNSSGGDDTSNVSYEREKDTGKWTVWMMLVANWWMDDDVGQRRIEWKCKNRGQQKIHLIEIGDEFLLRPSIAGVGWSDSWVGCSALFYSLQD